MHGKKSNLRYQLSSFLITIFSFLIFKCSHNLYSNVDNFNISLVTNGLFGDDTYTYYLHPWLCKIINAISLVFPSVDAYVFLMHVFLCGAMCMMYHLILIQKWKIKDKMFLIIILFTIQIDIGIWSYNYTLQATFFVLVGAAVLIKKMIDEENEKDIVDIILGSMFLGIGFMWRIQGALITIPFVCLVIIIEIFDHKNRMIVIMRAIQLFVFPIFFIIVLWVSQYSTETSQKYKAGIAYSEARTVVEDFPVKPWEEISDEIKDVSETEYNAAVSWLLIDTDIIDTELFREIADHGKTNAHSLSLGGILGAIKDLGYYALHQVSKVLECIILLTFVLIISWSGNNNKLYRIGILLALGGGGIILLYFSIRGRANAQVRYCILFSLLFVFLILLAKKNNEANKTKVTCMVGFCLTFICLMGTYSLLMKSDWRFPLWAINSRTDNANILVNEDYNDELYIWGRWHRDVTQTYMNAGKLPTQEFIDHNISSGDWMYGQKYFCEHLSKINAENLAVALLKRKNTYFVGENYEQVLQYLREEYDKRIEIRQVTMINDIPVWKFLINN